ncbi:MAG: recombinase family protein [Gaiellaceae bacterium MAG52_C11]|nr:recombinase family protein [Candidatus Gaiellasilicea maunaloa]
MSRRRLRRKTEKTQRHAPSRTGADDQFVVVRAATRVERLAYTRSQAAEALGISTSTFNRRVLPFIETVEMGWYTRLVPIDELERFAAERRREARSQRRPPARPGRKPGLPSEVVARIRDQHAEGKSLSEIARELNADSVPTSQGGRQWWPSTVRAVLVRPSPPSSGPTG